MTQIQIRRDTSTNWTEKNPTPAAGEPCFETDTGKFKIGDGTTAYNDLKYQTITNADVVDDTEVVGNKSWSSSKVNAELQAIASEVVKKQDKLTAGSAISMDNNEVAVKLYDPSKFTVVGSPTITEDGIASGFSNNSSYVKIGHLLKTTNFIARLQFTNVLSETSKAILGYIVNNYQCGLYINPSNKIYFYVGKLASGETTAFSLSSTTLIADTYSVCFGYKDTGYFIELYDKQGNLLDQISKDSNITYNINSYYPIIIGCNSGENKSLSFDGSIDLKSFSITVDGEEVFNGSKTIYTALDDKAQVTDLDTKASISLDNLTDAGKQVIKDMIPTTDIATTSSVGTVKPDGSTITITSDGTISAASNTPTNMVTTDTAQTITGSKTLKGDASIITVSDSSLTVNIGSSKPLYIGAYDIEVLDKGISLKNMNSLGLNSGTANSSNVRLYKDSESLIARYTSEPEAVLFNIQTSGKSYAYINSNEIYTRDVDGNFYQYINSQNIDTTYMKWDSTDNKLKVDTAAVAHLAFPSSTSVSLTLGASGTTYTAPADGYVTCVLKPTSNSVNSYMELLSTSSGPQDVAANSITVPASGNVGSHWHRAFIPIIASNSFLINYQNCKSDDYRFSFYYVVGTVPTA